MGEVAELQPRVLVRPDAARSLTAADIRHRVNLIQEVMQAVMKKDVHYGIIPGCKKPSLYKAGSEVLLATFQIGVGIEETDLSTEDCVRYRVKVIGSHTPTKTVMGEGIGECSSNEEKYKWRKAYDAEWNATPENRRRIKYGKYVDKQVRTEPADVANTILKMAKKRAQIDMTLTTTGASDCFEQDVEDLPEEYIDQRDPPRQKPAQQAAANVAPVDSPERRTLITELEGVAAKGADALAKHWSETLTRDQRQTVGADEIKRIKGLAEAADKKAGDEFLGEENANS